MLPTETESRVEPVASDWVQSALGKPWTRGQAEQAHSSGKKGQKTEQGSAVFIYIPCQGCLHPADLHLPAGSPDPQNGEMWTPLPGVLCEVLALSTQWDGGRSCCPSVP